MAFQILSEEDRLALLGEITEEEAGQLLFQLEELGAVIEIGTENDGACYIRVVKRQIRSDLEIRLVGLSFAATAKAVIAINEILLAVRIDLEDTSTVARNTRMGER